MKILQSNDSDVNLKAQIAELLSKKNITEPVNSEQSRKKKRRNRLQKHNNSSEFFNIEQNFEVQRILTQKLQNSFSTSLFRSSEKKEA